MYENLEVDLNLKLLVVGTESYYESGILMSYYQQDADNVKLPGNAAD